MAASALMPWFTFLFGLYAGYFGVGFFRDREPFDAVLATMALMGIVMCYIPTT